MGCDTHTIVRTGIVYGGLRISHYLSRAQMTYS